jgi:hypothetical protein
VINRPRWSVPGPGNSGATSPLFSAANSRAPGHGKRLRISPRRRPELLASGGNDCGFLRVSALNYSPTGGKRLRNWSCQRPKPLAQRRLAGGALPDSCLRPLSNASRHRALYASAGGAQQGADSREVGVTTRVPPCPYTIIEAAGAIAAAAAN